MKVTVRTAKMQKRTIVKETRKQNDWLLNNCLAKEPKHDHYTDGQAHYAWERKILGDNKHETITPEEAGELADSLCRDLHVKLAEIVIIPPTTKVGWGGIACYADKRVFLVHDWLGNKVFKSSVIHEIIHHVMYQKTGRVSQHSSDYMTSLLIKYFYKHDMLKTEDDVKTARTQQKMLLASTKEYLKNNPK